MAKNETALALTQDDFKAVAILGAQPGALAELIRENVGEDITPFDLPRIKVPSGGGIFWGYETATGPVSTPSVEGIIVHVHKSKSYWSVSLDDSTDNTPPDCMSFDCITGQGNPGGDCARCPMNKYESAQKGSGKACKDAADIYIITKTGIMPTIIQVPPTSLKALKKYGITIMDGGLRMSDVVTKFSLHSEKKSGKDTAIIDMAVAGPAPEGMKAFIASYKRDIVELLERSRPAAETVIGTDSRPVEDGQAPTFE